MKMKVIGGISLVAGILIVLALITLGCNDFFQNETSQGGQPASISGNQTSSILGKISHNVVLTTPMSKPVEKILIYKTIPHQYTRKDILLLAQKFNMSVTGKIKEVDEGSSIASEDGTLYAILHNSGSVEYTNTNRAHTVNPLDIPGNLPSDEEAEKIATKFLKDRDLLPEDAVFIGTEQGKILQLGENGSNSVVWADVEVWYGRMLNGLKVKGSQLSVAVGGGGDIIEYYANWREYEPYGEFPVKTPEQAFNELKTKGVAVGMTPLDATVSIDNAYLAYHTKAGAYTEEYLEPVWVFTGNVEMDGKSVEPVKEYVPALTDDAVKSLSS